MFHMLNSNLVGTPTKLGLKMTNDHEGKRVDNTFFKQILGSLMYLTSTSLDIKHAIILVSRYIE